MRSEEIPFDDAATYDLLNRGDTIAVFQLESSGMRDLIKRLRPDQFGDLVFIHFDPQAGSLQVFDRMD